MSEISCKVKQNMHYFVMCEKQLTAILVCSTHYCKTTLIDQANSSEMYCSKK